MANSAMSRDSEGEDIAEVDRGRFRGVRMGSLDAARGCEVLPVRKVEYGSTVSGVYLFSISARGKVEYISIKQRAMHRHREIHPQSTPQLVASSLLFTPSHFICGVCVSSTNATQPLTTQNRIFFTRVSKKQPSTHIQRARVFFNSYLSFSATSCIPEPALAPGLCGFGSASAVPARRSMLLKYVGLDD